MTFTKQYNWQIPSNSHIGLTIAEAARNKSALVVVTHDMQSAKQLLTELTFYLNDHPITPRLLPSWETLAYDHCSPHADIISQRLRTLYQLSHNQNCLLIVPVGMLMHRLIPVDFVKRHSFILNKNMTLNPTEFRQQIIDYGYHIASQVFEHGEVAIRGNIIDIFPMGLDHPIRIDLFDNEIESIRTFDPDTQRSESTIDSVELLPKHEYPLDPESIALFRENWCRHFDADPSLSPMYKAINQQQTFPGIEYYLPLFFKTTATLFDYLPKTCEIIHYPNLLQAAMDYQDSFEKRYKQLSHDHTKPILSPEKLIISPKQMSELSANFQTKSIQITKNQNDSTIDKMALQIHAHTAERPKQLDTLITQNWRLLFCSETQGRQQILANLLNPIDIRPTEITSWQQFIESDTALHSIITPIEQGYLLPDKKIAVLTESELLDSSVMQRRRRKKPTTSTDNLIQNLSELSIGHTIVHRDHGLGKYLGLKYLTHSGLKNEFIQIEYADQSMLYVPVTDLHLISRYSTGNTDAIDFDKLGSNRWEKRRAKAKQKIDDIAAKLLLLYAERSKKTFKAFKQPDHDYYQFVSEFPFEETDDQLNTTEAIIADLTSNRLMDRLVCGDVGFGKTEVAMRASFLTVNSGYQVAILVPTTLLCEQHVNTFKNRFANWPITIESLSRFKTTKQQNEVLGQLKQGKIDIIIGTHKLLSADIKYQQLGLLIIDEEHRFGVKQKEKIKSLQTAVNGLSLSATPIPRTMNMAMSGLRDLSIIATPPEQRLSVKTFVYPKNTSIIAEAIERELSRGGQVFYLHNDILTMPQIIDQLSKIVPNASIQSAHGQLTEFQLEKIMNDFYHQKFNVLVSTTIIESGIDIPTANTIIIERADKFGLAQLHQMRGRVGRSHHQAYAYLLTPDQGAVTSDGKKRLEVISKLDSLGAGFILASHDLEIRGAGQLLGAEQTGHIDSIGFSLYVEMLEQAVNALKDDNQTPLTLPTVDLGISNYIPESYLPDINNRLIQYKRISSITKQADLRELQVEFIDRFGLIPKETKHLFQIQSLKLNAAALGIEKITATDTHCSIYFNHQQQVDPAKVIELIQTEPQIYQLKGPQCLRIQLGSDHTKMFDILETVLAKIRKND